ncbi:Calreticulin/calnexin [Trema orientale]|uniref:Calreticulin/calnexin n=1 Tax=Trema orientale TaxID=63057 RepID=A0A2P5AGR8_TREOI|nr:Calreticulin/calnexin [Trema orientale]
MAMAMAIQGRKMRIYGVMIMLLSCFAFRICSSSDAILYESFEDSFEGRWIVSEKDNYNGLWKLSKSEGHDDHGLLVSEKARKYAIVKELDQNLALKDKTIALQFEVRLQNGLECGGAYLKYLRPQDVGWKAREFDNESPYSIMFGPDKCGSTNKVHFILKHKNPKNGEYVEHLDFLGGRQGRLLLTHKKIFDILYKIADLPFLSSYHPKIVDLIEKGEKQPNVTISILVSVVFVILTVLFRNFFGGKKRLVVNNSETSTGAPESSNSQVSGKEKEDEDEKGDDADAAPPRRRPARREK